MNLMPPNKALHRAARKKPRAAADAERTRTEDGLAPEGAGPDQRPRAGGFADRGGRGSHRDFIHPKVRKAVTVSGRPGDDAMHYQERPVQLAIKESQR
jgi:hypothetical protein